MIDQRFEHSEKQRYYRILLSHDLFGDWIVTRIWGGIGKASGRVTHIACSSYEEALMLIEKMIKIRKRRGYQLRETS